jgi:hypothetical protein
MGRPSKNSWNLLGIEPSELEKHQVSLREALLRWIMNGPRFEPIDHDEYYLTLR